MHGMNSRIILLSWIKRIVIISFIICCISTFRHWTNRISIPSDNNRVKNDISILHNFTKENKNIEIQVSFGNAISKLNDAHLTEITGQYEEVPAILTMNNTVRKYVTQEIYFSLTTNTKRILHTIHYLKFWAKRTGIRCLIVFEHKDLMNNKNIIKYLLQEGIPCQIQSSNVTDFLKRYFELFRMAWNNEYINKTSTKEKEIQWFAVGDDDTVWFINNLLHTLQQYNSSKSIYLGDVSDRTRQIVHHGGFFAYGGGGVLLSRPLALLFAKKTQECRRFGAGGDARIGKCVTVVLNTSLTKNNHFHQMDHAGDITGVMESGIDGLVTLHHMFSTWKPFPKEHTDKLNETMYLLEVAYRTFDKRFLKRYVKFNYKTNRTLLLTMGYSFSLFNRILSHAELTLVESTWCCANNMPTRKSRPKENNKITWFFRSLTSKTSNGLIRYRIVHENKKNTYPQILNIELHQ
jgi:hypothetical protein